MSAIKAKCELRGQQRFSISTGFENKIPGSKEKLVDEVVLAVPSRVQWLVMDNASFIEDVKINVHRHFVVWGKETR